MVGAMQAGFQCEKAAQLAVFIENQVCS